MTHVRKQQGPVVQSIISLASLLVVKKFTVLVTTISNSQIFLLEKKNLSSFFSAKMLAYNYAIVNDQSFNGLFTNNIVSFEQLGLENMPVAHL